MNPVKTCNVTLNVKDVDCFNHWKPSSIAEIMLEVANRQCVETGWSWDDLLKKGIILVMTRTHIEMTEYPGTNQTITVSTWADPNMRLAINRFFIFEHDGKKIGEAAVQTVLVEYDTRKIVRAAKYDLNIIPYTDNMPTVSCSINKTGAECYDFDHPIAREDRKVRFNNMDYNGHLHNTQYILFAEDMLGMDFFKERTITSVDIKYDKELHYDETPTLLMASEKSIATSDDPLANVMITGDYLSSRNFEIIVKSKK